MSPFWSSLAYIVLRSSWSQLHGGNPHFESIAIPILSLNPFLVLFGCHLSSIFIKWLNYNNSWLHFIYDAFLYFHDFLYNLVLEDIKLLQKFISKVSSLSDSHVWPHKWWFSPQLCYILFFFVFLVLILCQQNVFNCLIVVFSWLILFMSYMNLVLDVRITPRY